MIFTGTYVIIIFFFFLGAYFFQDSLQSLKMAQNKLQDSKEVLEKVTPESKGSDVMVPLTGSVSFIVHSFIWVN